LELLVAMVVFVILMSILVTFASSLGATWQRGIAHGERRAIALNVFSRITRDLQQAAGPSDFSGGNLQFVINPANLDTNYTLPQAAFWKASVATDRSQGNLAEVGYFVQWVNDPDTGSNSPKLCRYFANPSANGYLNHTATNAWIDANLLKTNAPATKASAYTGLLADHVLGFWIQPVDQNGNNIFPSGSAAYGQFDSYTGYSVLNGTVTNVFQKALPPAVRVAIVTVDSRTAKRLTGNEKPGPRSGNGFWADVYDFVNTLPPSIQSGVEVHGTIINLPAAPR
jgi:hypothetical protein